MSVVPKSDLILEIAHAIVAAEISAEAAQRLEMAAKRAGQGVESNYFLSGYQAASDTHSRLRDALPFLPAQSLDAAMVQLSEAVNLVEWLADIVDEGEAKEAKRLRTALHRLITSALRAIESHSGHNLGSLGLERIREAYCDPWLDPTDAIAMVRADRD